MSRTLLLIAHVWIGAIWLGAAWFSLVNLHRRGPRLFADDAEAERVIAGLSRGNRWLMLSAAAALALTGGLAWALTDDPRPDAWTAALVAKVALLAGNVAITAYVSWILWPRRLFALPAELPPIRRRQTALRTLSVLALAASAALGVAAHALRSAP